MASCKKDDQVPVAPAAPFTVTFHNDFTEIQRHYAAYFSDEEGKVLAFRWLNGNDTTRLTVSDLPDVAALDLTLVMIKATDASGSGQLDTAVAVHTYTATPNGAVLRLRDQNYRQETTLNISFSGVTTFDSIIVPDGLTFQRPQPSNNFTAFYRVLHTGKIWLRIRVNGESDWRYMFFDNVQSSQVSAAFDVNILPIETKPKAIQLPFVATWDYRVEGVVDTAQRKLLSLGDLLRAPGGALPVLSELKVYEPITFDPLSPSMPFYQTYRLRFSGTSADGVGYHLDKFVDALPDALPTALFEITALTLGDNRLGSVRCSGDLDVLAMVRKHNGSPAITWETYHQPANFLFYRLPDVPVALGSLYPALKNYDFNQSVRARAESYEWLPNYGAVRQKIFSGEDELWKTKAGMIGKEIEL